MSCGCNNSYSDGNAYYGACCPDVPYPQVSHESVPSLIDNLTTALYGAFYNPSTQTGFITKTVVNGRIVWNIACDPNNTAQITGLPRNTGEGLLCYLIRAFNYLEGTQIPTFVTLTGTQTLTNKTLTAPTLTGITTFPNGTIDASGNITTTGDLSGTNLTATGTVTLPTGSVSNDALAGAPATANTASTIVLRDASGNFSAGTITAALSGNASSATTAAACSGNAATATTAAACSGNAATATTAAACSGNAATASAAQASSTLAGLLPKSFANVSAAGVVSNNVGLTITGGSPTSGVFTLTCTGVSASNVVLVTPQAPTTSGYAATGVPTTNTITVRTFSGSAATAEPFSIVIF